MNFRLQKILAWPICLIFLTGMIFAGDSNVLCIDDNGLVEFKTLCLPLCGDAHKSCENGLLGDRQDVLADCSHCSDIEIDVPLLSNRIQKTDSERLSQFISGFTSIVYFSPIFTEDSNPQIIKFYLAYGQSPPIYSLTTTILRC